MGPYRCAILKVNSDNPIPTVKQRKQGNGKKLSRGKKLGNVGSKNVSKKWGWERYSKYILDELFLFKHRVLAYPFYKPVDAEDLGLHDYHKIIKKPMDLGTIRQNLQDGHYKLLAEVVEDIRLIFSNCYLYNPEDDKVFRKAKKLEIIFEGILAKVPKKMLLAEGNKAQGGKVQKEDKPATKKQKRKLPVTEVKVDKGPELPPLPPSFKKLNPVAGAFVHRKRDANLVRYGLSELETEKLKEFPYEELRKLKFSVEKMSEVKLQKVIRILKREEKDFRYLNVGGENDVCVDLHQLKISTLQKLKEFALSAPKAPGSGPLNKLQMKHSQPQRNETQASHQRIQDKDQTLPGPSRLA